MLLRLIVEWDGLLWFSGENCDQISMGFFQIYDQCSHENGQFLYPSFKQPVSGRDSPLEHEIWCSRDV